MGLYNKSLVIRLNANDGQLCLTWGLCRVTKNVSQQRPQEVDIIFKKRNVLLPIDRYIVVDTNIRLTIDMLGLKQIQR